MKKIIQFFLLFILIIISWTCRKDENLTHISDFERKIYLAVNNYRAGQSLPSITLQYLMVDDAQQYSAKMANHTVPYGVDDIMASLNTLKTNLGGDASGAVVQFSEYENADTIVNRMVRDAVKRQVLEQNFNQTGVGVAKDDDGNWYVTQLFIHIP